jgi:hypothetical protein
MAKIVKFIYVRIIFIFLFLIAGNIAGKMFYIILLWFLLYFIFYPILITLSDSLIFFFTFITVNIKCKFDSDCPPYMCAYPLKAKCVSYKCKCKDMDIGLWVFYLCETGCWFVDHQIWSCNMSWWWILGLWTLYLNFGALLGFLALTIDVVGIFFCKDFCMSWFCGLCSSWAQFYY